MPPEIPKPQELEEKVFGISNDESFQTIALEVYNFQFHNNILYRRFSLAMGKEPSMVRSTGDIPFLPISFFKTHEVRTTAFETQLIFESSGTTGSVNSKHFIKKPSLYEKSFLRGFENYFGEPGNFCILGLLPSYLERKNSSLVYMVHELIKKSGHKKSGFYLNDHEKLKNVLLSLEQEGQETILFGVSYALLDFADDFPMQLKYTRVVETGGMKGRRKELTKPELYNALKKGLGIDKVYAEYGMTELLSQAYAENGLYTTPPWMKVFMRDETDPLSYVENGRPGVMNVIDLANLYSCSFIATEDAGKYINGKFEVLGRINNSDIRGCSLMVAE